MATDNNKKYFYMRLKEDFFSSDEIIILEGMPDGYLYSNILLKLYLKSLKNNGKLMLNEFIPYSPTMISQLTGHSVGVVEKSLGIFQQLGLIDVLDNGAIYMLSIQEYIGKSSTEADRKREYRKKIEEEKKRLLGIGQMSGQIEDKAATETDIETETDLDKDLDTDKQTDTEKEPPAELNPRQQERVEFLRDLFDGWKINDNQIFHLSTLVNARIPYDPMMGINGVELKIYDMLQDLTLRAKSYNVQYIYGWMLKVIPEMDFYE